MTHDRVQEILDVEAIKQLKARYFRLLDAKDWDGFMDIFTEDVELIYAVPEEQFVPPGAEPTPDGRARVRRDQLLSFLRDGDQSIRTFHLCHMPEITLEGADNAVGLWRMTDYTQIPSEGGPTWFRGYGWYEDRYVRTDRGWRINRSVFHRHEIDPMPRA